MFRSITALVLIFSISLTNFTKLFIYAGFELNQTYIVAELCENRDTPELNCNGQCYLAKKIKQAEEKEKQQERESQKQHVQEAFLTEKVALNAPVFAVKTLNLPEVGFQTPQPSFIIFHPPQA